jgi:hypothetical protein
MAIVDLGLNAVVEAGEEEEGEEAGSGEGVDHLGVDAQLEQQGALTGRSAWGGGGSHFLHVCLKVLFYYRKTYVLICN